MNNNFDLDLSKELDTRQNLKKSKIITLGSVFIGALLLLISSVILENLWLLAGAILLIGSGLWFLYFVRMIEKRFLTDSSDLDINIHNTQNLDDENG